MNWFLFATVLLYVGAAIWEALAGHEWKAVLIVAYAVSNFALMRI